MDDDFDVEMSVSSIMEHTGLDHETCKNAFEALNEGQRVFNAAKKVDAKKVIVSRTSLYRLMVMSAGFMGMENLGSKNIQ